MARGIESLTPGEELTLRYHGSRRLGLDPRDEKVRFIEMKGEGTDRRAVFADYVPGHGEWEAYIYRGYWAFGSSAERLTIVE